MVRLPSIGHLLVQVAIGGIFYCILSAGYLLLVSEIKESCNYELKKIICRTRAILKRHKEN